MITPECEKSPPVKGCDTTGQDGLRLSTTALRCDNKQVENAGGPAGAVTPTGPGDQQPTQHEMEQISLSLSLIDQPDNSDYRDHAVALLDAVRRDCERFRGSLDTALRVRGHYITLGRRYGMSNADIGEVLGITESAVRKALSVAAVD